MNRGLRLGRLVAVLIIPVFLILAHVAFWHWRSRVWLFTLSLPWLACWGFPRFLRGLALLQLCFLVGWWCRPGSVGSVQALPAAGFWPDFIAEADWARLGVQLFRPGESGRILALTEPIYGAMEQDLEYARLPHSVLATLTNGPAPTYVFLPASLGPSHRAPCLFFFHGAFGSFQSYLYFWQRWASVRGWAVVCPGFGLGNWRSPGALEHAEGEFRSALAGLPIDSGQCYFVGHSNGAVAASHLARTFPECRGLLLVSPVIPVQELRKVKVAVEVVHGDEDRQIPLRVVQQQVASLQASGSRIHLKVLSGQDHYLLFGAAHSVYRSLRKLQIHP